jgi:tRNA A-37 threonylcarbamoyl transferase component Bud32/Tol biopolymer transport system component
MNNILSSHPGVERLGAFRVGKVSLEELTEIEHHLAECPVCCQSLKALPDDGLVDLMRKSFNTPTVAAGATPADSLNQAGGLTGEQAAPAPEAGVPAELAEHPRYRVRALLGTGGMGAVYRAEHRLMERTVALKVIRRDLTDRPAVVERFRREVKAAAQLDHPNIVRAYDAEQAGDRHFLVMECVQGTTLARRLAEKGPLPSGLACEYVRQAALGLQHAYEHGMVHRDVKPHNLMVTPGGQIKILDFGLARLASELAPADAATASGIVLGTADYIAPEQADDPHAADTRADVYALGCTLYFLLTGQPPFPEGTLMQKLMAHSKRSFRPVTDFRNDVPPGLVRVLDRMTAKLPGDRYQTPGEVARALAPFVKTPPSAADGAATTEFVRSARRSPLTRRFWLAVAATVALLVLGGGLLGVVAYRIATDKGEFVVGVDDPEVEMMLAKHGLTVKDRKTNREYVLKAGRQELRTGDYEIEVTEETGGLDFSTKQFRIVHDGKERVKVTLKAAIKVREIRRFEGHTDAAVAVAYAADGRRALSGSNDNTARLWDVETGKELRRFEGHGDIVTAVAISPDGRRALSASKDGTARIWDTESGKELRQLEGHGGWVWDVAFSPDGRRALTCGRADAVCLWDVETAKELRRFEGHGADVKAVAFSPDGRRALTGGGDCTMRLWDVDTGKELRCLEGHTNGLRSVAFSPDGRRALSGSYDKTIRLWDLETGKELRRFEGHTNWVHGVAFSPDGRRALSGNWDATVRLWEVESGRELYRFDPGIGKVESVAFSPDGRRALIGGWDKTVRLWRLPDPPPPE